MLSKLNLVKARVIDLTQWLPGPFAAQILSDLGADVVKVEPPGGDPMKTLGPKDSDGVSAWYKSYNKGKTIVTANLKDSQDSLKIQQLIKKADVILESFRPGTLDKLGLSNKKIRELNPSIVHCALSGYGQTGSKRLVGGHDINYMAIGGALAYSGTSETPVNAYPPEADFSSALQSVISILAALNRRERTKQPAYIDVSLMETVMGWQSLAFTAAIRKDKEYTERGQGVLNGGAAYYQIYKTKDGRFVSLGAIEPKFWETFCATIRRPEWTKRQNETVPQKNLIQDVRNVIGSKTLKEWESLFQGVDCCFAPILEVEEVVKDDHIMKRGILKQIDELTIESSYPALIDGKVQGQRDDIIISSLDKVLNDWN